MAVRRILQKSGYRVITAANGAEAMEELSTHGTQIAVVLTDMVMPVMGGRELVERASRAYPAVRIVCMSGYTEDPALRLGQLGDEHAFVSKPFTVAELTAAIRRVLDAPVTTKAPLAAIS